MSDDMSAYRDVFLSESAEYVQSIVDGLLALESNPGDSEPVETIFRGAHSLKGMAAAMGYDATAELTHKMESLMDTVRKGEQGPDESLIDLVLRATDVVKELIEAESNEKAPPSVDALIAEIEQRTDGPSHGSAPARTADTAVSEDSVAADGSAFKVDVTLSADCVLKSVRAYMVLKRLNFIGTVLETVPDSQDLEDEKFDTTFTVVLQTTQDVSQIEDAALHITDVESVTVAAVDTPTPAPEQDRPSADVSVPRISDAQTVRVSISHLDSLVNLVGEMVTVRSRLESISSELGRRDLGEAIEEFRRISSELQHEVMETRMVPVGNIFNRFPRMVRDLARDLGKEVEFEMAGLDIELDRTVLDEIGDPIVHLLRNAIDHGVEASDARVGADKPVRGSVRLEARRERDTVSIVVADDGAGMDVDRIWAKAVERGLCREDERETTSDEDILLMTCEAGFSTVATATQVSGRGVGMDVVKGKIEYLGGSLVIHSTPGVGSEFVLTLPLTLAIVQALVVGSGESAFAIPLSAVSEVVSREETPLDTVDGRPVVVLRDGTVVPIYRLDVITGRCDDPSQFPDEHEHVVLLESGEQLRALAVERLVGRQEVVIKPLSPMFKHIRGLGGATVMGDGSIALILDPRSFFAMGEVRS